MGTRRAGPNRTSNPGLPMSGGGKRRTVADPLAFLVSSSSLAPPNVGLPNLELNGFRLIKTHGGSIAAA